MLNVFGLFWMSLVIALNKIFNFFKIYFVGPRSLALSKAFPMHKILNASIIQPLSNESLHFILLVLYSFLHVFF